MIGGYTFQAKDYGPGCNKVEIILPRKWKGQMNKDVVKARVELADPSLIGKIHTDHTMDAVGIGFSFKGVL